MGLLIDNNPLPATKVSYLCTSFGVNILLQAKLLIFHSTSLLPSNFICPQIVANVSGCSLDSTKQIADCMRSLDFDAILGFTQVRYSETDKH